MYCVKPRCCWHKEQIASEDCPYLQDQDRALLLNRKNRFMQRCLECPLFLEDLREMNGELDGLAGLFPYAIEELLALKAQVKTLSSLHESRSREIKFLHEVSLVLQTSVDMDEVIAMALTAVTAGKGFGLNRAILLLVDKERQKLKGYFGVGPRYREDAGPIWREIEERNYTLREQARHFFEEKMTAERERFRDLLELLSVPLSNGDHLFVQTLNEQVSRHVIDLFREPGVDRAQAEALGATEMILVPLISNKRRIGLLLADNIINGRPIDPEDLQSLETFALPVSFAIERASLYERLQEELVKLTEANRRLKEQQEQIVRMEKMALVGKITSNIAHSIRNPLTIIGGFARSLIKSTPEQDSKRQYIESIARETRRLEDVLQEVLAYSESLHPTLDLWDVNQLITGICAGMQDDLKAARTDCRLQLAPSLPQLRIDYKQMTHCLRSIINNAMEAMPEGGTIGIGTSHSDDELHIVIQDNGPGMGAETIRSVTEPFFSTKDKGSGLGLSLCARILEGHGARLDIDSRLGAGTTFTIRLPLAAQAPSTNQN